LTVKLTRRSIDENRAAWAEKGYALPDYDIGRMARATAAAPEWVHFGAGNLFRALPAALCDWALSAGRTQSGIIVASGHDAGMLEAAYRPFDNLFVLVSLTPQGAAEKRVVGSVAEALSMRRAHPDWARLFEVFRSPSLKIASLAITEKGYNMEGSDGRPLPEAARDFAAGPSKAEGYLGRVAALLYERYLAGALPLSLVSMDNCAKNGDRLRGAMSAYARAWVARGLAAPGFLDYIEDRGRVGFPVTMVDKITPRPDDGVAAMLEADGLEGARAVRTEAGGLAAPFVNAEPAQYLVVEDWFPNGRPDISGAPGVVFAPREAVIRAERMKVCALLNPLHTALAVFGCLMGYARIADEMRDALLVRLVRTLGEGEGLPTVEPGALDPEGFLETLIRKRLPNPRLPDSPQRIAADTSQKLAVRFGETIRAHGKRDGLTVERLVAVPLTIAGWLRYLLAVDDAGNSFVPSPDPRLSELQAALSDICLGDSGPFSALRPILSDKTIFGLDLYEAGLGGRIEGYFAEMLAGPGAVRRALERHLPSEGAAL
jgi:fructuronate reductase